MPKQLTQDQLNDLVDIIGGLYGNSQPTQTVDEPDQVTEPSVSQTPAPSPVPQQTSPAMPQAPANPIPGVREAAQPQQSKVPPSPYGNLWHKSLSRRKQEAYIPTVAYAPRPPQAKPTAPTHSPTVRSLVYRQRPQRQPAAQPFQQVETPPPQKPRDQENLLAKIQHQAERRGGEKVGTNLAHIIRASRVDPSIARQYQAASVLSLRELTKILNEGHRATPNEEVPLDEFHDDDSPFVVLSHPRQTLTQGGAPAVVVGKPYAGLTHQLEMAFPGVHFFPADEARAELERAAAQVAKPLPAKSLRVPLSPYGRKGSQIKIKDQQETTPLNPPKKQEAKPIPSQESQINVPKEPSNNFSISLDNPSAMAPRADRIPVGPRSINPNSPTNPAVPAPSASASSSSEAEPWVPEALAWEAIKPQQFANIDEYLNQIEENITDQIRQRRVPSSWRESLKYEAMENAREIWYDHLRELERLEEIKQEDTQLSIRSEVGHVLRSGEIINKEPTGTRTLNKAFRIEFADGSKGLFKPAAGENRGGLAAGPELLVRSGIPRQTYYRREVFYSSAARLLKIQHLVPETVFREVDGEVGSIQHWQDQASVATPLYDTPDEAKMWDGDEDLATLAALDYVLGNTDRNLGNWMIREDGRIVAIDNGLSMTGDLSDWAGAAKYRQMEILRQASLVKNLAVPSIGHWQELWSDVEELAKECKIEHHALEMAKERLNLLSEHSGRSFADVPAPDGTKFGLAAWFRDLEEQARLEEMGSHQSVPSGRTS